MTHVVRDPVSYDGSYQRALQARAGSVPSGGSEIDQSNPFVAHVPLGSRIPHGPSHLGYGDHNLPPLDTEGSTSRHRRRE